MESGLRMKIWVDAAACLVVVLVFLFCAAERVAVMVTLVDNKPLRVLGSGGFDVADHWIVAEVQAGDLVITADIPLAAAVIEKGAQALGPRGELYTAYNIRERLNVRDFMDQLRSSGVNTGGPAALSAADRRAFACHLDRLLAKCPAAAVTCGTRASSQIFVEITMRSLVRYRNT